MRVGGYEDLRGDAKRRGPGCDRTSKRVANARTTEGSVDDYRTVTDVRFIDGDRHRVTVGFENLLGSAGNTEYRNIVDSAWQIVGQSKGEYEVGHNGLEIEVEEGFDRPPMLIAREKDASRVIWDPNLQLRNVELGHVSPYTWKDKEGRERDREPIKDAASIKAALHKWILPAIGDMPLGSVNNITVKPLVDQMQKSKSLSARTVNKYVEYIKQVVASLKDGETGEPIHKRRWDSSVMDLPMVNQREQRRPSLKASAISQLVKESEGDEQALYVLLAATGMRVPEALGLETRHLANHGRTIEVRQQVDRDTPHIVPCLKTAAAYRDIDLHPDVAEFQRRFIGEKKGLLFATRNGTPHLHNNIEDRWLTERLRAMGLDEPGMGWHAFRRFRKTWLRGKRCQEDINIFWMGHKPKTMSEIYSHLFEEIDMRLAEAEAVGFGFDLPKNPSEKAVVAPIAPRFKTEVFQEVAVSA
jgi:integrase